MDRLLRSTIAVEPRNGRRVLAPLLELGSSPLASRAAALLSSPQLLPADGIRMDPRYLQCRDLLLARCRRRRGACVDLADVLRRRRAMPGGRLHLEPAPQRQPARA